MADRAVLSVRKIDHRSIPQQESRLIAAGWQIVPRLYHPRDRPLRLRTVFSIQKVFSCKNNDEDHRSRCYPPAHEDNTSMGRFFPLLLNDLLHSVEQAFSDSFGGFRL